MQRHPRTVICAQAANKLFSAVLDIEKDHRLTSLEGVMMVERLCADRIASYLKFELRYERHGTYDYPGDEAGPPPRPRAKFKRRE